MQYLITTRMIREPVLHTLVLVSYSCGNGRSCRLPVLTNGLLIYQDIILALPCLL